MCFKNWTGSATGMESDIIVQGFNSSVTMHNVRYKKFVADGDSTVFKKIRECVDYGKQVKKVECTNHSVKNYGKALHKIKNNTKSIKIGVRKLLTNETIERLVKNAQAAIYANAGGNSNNLKDDLRTSVTHVFGDHRTCQQYFCGKVGQVEQEKYDPFLQTGAHHNIYAPLNPLLLKSDK